MKTFVIENTETIDYKEFIKLSKKFKQIRLLNNGVYYLLNKKDLYKMIKMQQSEIICRYWEHKFDVLWVINIDNNLK